MSILKWLSWIGLMRRRCLLLGQTKMCLSLASLPLLQRWSVNRQNTVNPPRKKPHPSVLSLIYLTWYPAFLIFHDITSNKSLTISQEQMNQTKLLVILQKAEPNLKPDAFISTLFFRETLTSSSSASGRLINSLARRYRFGLSLSS